MTSIVECHPSYQKSRKRRISWKAYLRDWERFLRSLPPDRYSEVFGVPRGGLIPAVLASHLLGLRVRNDSIALVQVVPGLLVVDDLVDTGRTLSLCPNDVAVLYRKPWSAVEPTYWYRETERWIVFPYE